jgi:hypothetical protein
MQAQRPAYYGTVLHDPPAHRGLSLTLKSDPAASAVGMQALPCRLLLAADAEAYLLPLGRLAAVSAAGLPASTQYHANKGRQAGACSRIGLEGEHAAAVKGAYAMHCCCCVCCCAVCGPVLLRSLTTGHAPNKAALLISATSCRERPCSACCHDIHHAGGYGMYWVCMRTVYIICT